MASEKRKYEPDEMVCALDANQAFPQDRMQSESAKETEEIAKPVVKSDGHADDIQDLDTFEIEKENLAGKTAKSTSTLRLVILIVAACAVAMTAIILIAFRFSGNSYEGVLDRYYDSLTSANVNKYMSLLAEDYFDHDNTCASKEEYKEYYGKKISDSQEVFQWYCGDDFCITYEILDYTEHTKENIDDHGLFADTYGKANNIEKAIDVSIEVTVSGSETTEKSTSVISLVSIQGKWYLSESYI